MKFRRKHWYLALATLALLEVAAYYAVMRLDLKPRNWFAIYSAMAGAILLTFIMSRLAPEHPAPFLAMIPRGNWEALFFAFSIVFLMSLAISPIVFVAVLIRFKEVSVRAWLPLGGIVVGFISGGVSWFLLRKELRRWTDVLSIFGTTVGIFGGIGAAIAFL